LPGKDKDRSFAARRGLGLSRCESEHVSPRVPGA
jgi:hypothetical protein